MNSVNLIGRLARDVEYKSLENITVSRYSLAVDRNSKDKKTDFINIVAYGKSADFASAYLKKGMKIGITGRIETNTYTNKDGQKVYAVYVVADKHYFCESKKEEQKENVTVGDIMSGFQSADDGLSFLNS